MQLTGKQIVERGIVSNFDELTAIQQQGVDVRIDKVYRNKFHAPGKVNISGTKIPKYEEIQPVNGVFTLDPGYYEVQLIEAVHVPNNCSLHFKTRSSLVRCGALVHSGQFDAGFETETAGCFLQVIEPINIERAARIAQALCFESAPVDNLYDGQWQNDKQRK